jgi:hypothetical protein
MMATNKIGLFKTLEFDLPFIYKNDIIYAVATIMQVYNPLGKPMIRVCLDVHQKTPDVYIYYMLDSIEDLFNYPIPQLPPHDKRYQVYEEKYMINEIIKRTLIEKLFELEIEYDDWKL